MVPQFDATSFLEGLFGPMESSLAAPRPEAPADARAEADPEQFRPFAVDAAGNVRYLDDDELSTWLADCRRAMVAARIANLKEGRPSKETSQNCGVSKREDAAKLLNVSSRSIDAAEAFDESPSDPWGDAEEPGDGCPRCGSLASWWTPLGTRKCIRCEPPRPDSATIRAKAARIRQQTAKWRD